MIGFIDTKPKVEPYNGLFQLTLDDQVFVLTRHAVQFLEHQCCMAQAKATIAHMEDGAKLVPFPSPERRRRK